MMVASTSLIKLQQHRFISDDPSDSDMAYHMQHEGQSFDQSPVFSHERNSFQQMADSKFGAPGYKEDASNHGMRTFNPSSGSDPFYPDSRNSDSGSPPDEKFVQRVMGHTLVPSYKMHSSNNYGNRKSPDRLSPPHKRPVPNSSPTQIYNSRMTAPTNVQLSPSDLESNITDSRFSVADQNCRRSNSGIVRQRSFNNGSSTDMNNSSGISFDGLAAQTYYERPYSTSHKDFNENEIDLPQSPTNKRHPSQSSTHSSSSSIVSKPATPSRTVAVKSSKTPTKVQPQGHNYFFDDDDDDSWKICSVCGDKATGYHFNALTCEGCKGFFRRSMKNSKSFTCPYTGNCTITKSNRRQCQACRLVKCLRIGMKKECIMSRTEIQMKKNLMLHNKIKKSIMEWKPVEFTSAKQNLVQLILQSHCQTNNPPPPPTDETVGERNPSSSPSSSTGSAFSDLINQMTQDIVATAPGQSSASKAHMQHFSAIMEFSIKEIIKFCKKIPNFITLSIKDQITLLKSGCTEILFIKANYTYDREQEALMCGPGKYYTRDSFILGGMSEEYTDCYLKFHHDLSHMRLDDTELACVCAATLFSSDRDALENRSLVEFQQEEIIMALQAYTETTYHCRVRFPKIMSYLSRLRTLNWHISQTLSKLQNTESAEDITPLVLEVLPSV